jgi:hypothetical protein
MYHPHILIRQSPLKADNALGNKKISLGKAFIEQKC